MKFACSRNAVNDTIKTFSLLMLPSVKLNLEVIRFYASDSNISGLTLLTRIFAVFDQVLNAIRSCIDETGISITTICGRLKGVSQNAIRLFVVAHSSYIRLANAVNCIISYSFSSTPMLLW
jgi:hypothetical protein